MFATSKIRIKLFLMFVAGCAISVCLFRYLVKEPKRSHENFILIEKTIFEGMQKRRNIVKNFCANWKYKAENYKKVAYTLKKMFIDNEHNISWCPVFKAASSTWMKGFAQLRGILDKNIHKLLNRGLLQWNMVARKAYPLNEDTQLTITKLKQTKSFLIVRHPFERILSAYRDKLEHKEGREYYFRRYGEQISRLYRQHNLNKPEPTFAEFLVYLATNRDFDEHWSPIIEQCHPCSIKYDYILKTETFEQDNDFLLRQLNLTSKINVNTRENVNPLGNTDFNVAKMYYKNIPRKLIEKVYELYKDDFKLFSYSPHEYYAMTTS